MQKAIGIFGGTFNPVHNGHIAMAKAAADEFDLSKVVFLPNGNPPHKDNTDLIPSFHRYNMVALATESESIFDISDYEIKRTLPSYTIDTQRALKKIYNCPLYFIIGADSLYTLYKWKSYKQLIKECSFIVADRSCDGRSDAHNVCKSFNDSGGSFSLLNMPRVDITSTQIRQLLASGGDISPYVPKKVFKYISDNNLYRD